jgi:hypothetical protein
MANATRDRHNMLTTDNLMDPTSWLSSRGSSLDSHTNPIAAAVKAAQAQVNGSLPRQASQRRKRPTVPGRPSCAKLQRGCRLGLEVRTWPTWLLGGTGRSWFPFHLRAGRASSPHHIGQYLVTKRPRCRRLSRPGEMNAHSAELHLCAAACLLPRGLSSKTVRNTPQPNCKQEQ